jgi:hypothetical protein
MNTRFGSFRPRAALIAASLLVLSTTAFGSITGKIAGTVRDATGAVVPGA